MTTWSSNPPKIAVGSLEVETRRETAALGPEQAARDELDYYRNMPGDRSGWRVARTVSGQLVGLAVPSRNAYGHDLLAEITHFHAMGGPQTVTGTTDTTNTPVASAFACAGYRNTERRLQYSAPPA